MLTDPSDHFWSVKAVVQMTGEVEDLGEAVDVPLVLTSNAPMA
jgi:hypothetical protein